MIASLVGVLGVVGIVVYQNMPEKGDEPPDDETRKESVEDLKDFQKDPEGPEGEPTVPEPGQAPVDPIPDPPKEVIPERIPPPDRTDVIKDQTGKFELYWKTVSKDGDGKDIAIPQFNPTQIFEAYRRGDRTFCEGPLANYCDRFKSATELEARRQASIEAQLKGISPKDPRTDLERLLDLSLWNGVQQYFDGVHNVPALGYNDHPSAEYLNTQCRTQRIGYEFNEPGFGTLRGFSQDECNKLANNFPVTWNPGDGTCVQRLENPRTGQPKTGTSFSSACGPLPKFSDAQ